MFNMKAIQFPLCLLVLYTPFAVLRAQTNIAADDPNIQYIGRFDLTTPTAPAFDWSYCSISAKFQGTSCSVKLGGTSKYFDLYVDGAKTGSIKSANGGLETLPVASGLADGVHSVALCRRDEASKGLNTFQGFVLDTGKALVAPDARPCRKLEFIGDSFTCGYGDEGAYGSSFSYATENACITYAAQMAKHYTADCMITAWSGKGMVRNYGVATQTSPDPMPYYYPRTCGSVATNNYAFTWQPDVAVVVLGINDFSTSPNPSQAQYVGGYSNFVKTLRGHYPNADIICTYLSSMASTARGYIQTVVSTSGDSKVHFASVSYTLVSPTDLGSDGHPNLSGQTKIANAFIPAFDGIMGTAWGSAPHGTPLTWLRSYGFTNDFALAEEDDPDGDGMKTWEEYRAGTDPTNAASVFRLQEIAPVANGIRLTWSGTTNSGATTPFLIYCATNLFSPVWELRSGSIPRAGNGLNVWTDSVPASGTPVFYRVAVPAR
jgi:hypothetical protein